MTYVILGQHTSLQAGRAGNHNKASIFAATRLFFHKRNIDLELWKARSQYRAELRRLLCIGEYMVKDVGLSYEDALRESQKPFWVE